MTRFNGLKPFIGHTESDTQRVEGNTCLPVLVTVLQIPVKEIFLFCHECLFRRKGQRVVKPKVVHRVTEY